MSSNQSMPKMLIIASAGVVIPQSLIAMFRYRAKAVQSYEVNIGSQNDTVAFQLHSKKAVVFYQYVNLNIDSGDGGILSDQQDFITDHKIEPFMQSELFSSLSNRTSERVQEILHKIIKARQRITIADEELARLQQLFGGNISEPQNSAQLTEVELERRKRNRQLTHRQNELREFTEAKSADLTELLDIPEFIATGHMTAGAMDFYEQWLDENHNDRGEKKKTLFEADGQERRVLDATVE